MLRENVGHTEPVQFAVFVSSPMTESHQQVEGAAGAVEMGGLHQRRRLRCLLLDRGLFEQHDSAIGLGGTGFHGSPVGHTTEPRGQLVLSGLPFCRSIGGSVHLLYGGRGAGAPVVAIAVEVIILPQRPQQPYPLCGVCRYRVVQSQQFVQTPDTVGIGFDHHLPQRRQIDVASGSVAVLVDNPETSQAILRGPGGHLLA